MLKDRLKQDFKLAENFALFYDANVSDIFMAPISFPKSHRLQYCIKISAEQTKIPNVVVLTDDGFVLTYCNKYQFINLIK